MISLPVLTVILLFSSCKTAEPLVKNGLALDTIVSITLYDNKHEDLLDSAFEIIDKYENMFSKTIENSDINRINSRTEDSVEVSQETADLINTALKYSKISNGSFDITVDIISRLWGFSDTPSVPDQQDIERLLPYVDHNYVSVNGNTVTISDPNVKIDLGAIAKGYIADKVKEYLIASGVKNAIINLGGNVLCIGGKPSGEPMKIGIKKPFFNDISMTVKIMNESVVSSGVYERNFEVNGKLYHHIINPKTGYPYDNGLLSVTIISENSTDGDALSTSCFALGLVKGMELVDSLNNVYAVFITDDFELHYSEGAEDFIA